MKETYKVGTPRHIVWGDPLHFEEFTGAKLKRLVVDITPPKKFETRIVLEEEWNEEVKMNFSKMLIYLAPISTIETYMQDKYYEGQVEKKKYIGVDSARYKLVVDDRGKIFYTGADGWCGSYWEYTRTRNRTQTRGRKTILDAQVIEMFMPYDMTLDELRETMKSLFPDCEQIENLVGGECEDNSPKME